PDAQTSVQVATPAPPPRSLAASLVNVNQKGKRRLKIVVKDADTGEIKAQFDSPFQRPTFRQIAVLALDIDGDGVVDAVRLTARRLGQSKKLLVRTFSV